jgi:carbamoyl-phosphate synthase large subunit
MDPMGIHTGDSITVAPAMTLSDTAFQRMRDMAIKMMRSIGDFAGGCNVQFAVSPDEKEEIIAIEINPRVSRSSALASKATGYPIAKIAAKLAIGYCLDELENQITQSTSALFEPTLDYVIVKIPRWNFDKFEGSDRKLGLQMKSVGEVMGIGRSFQEALHKATQSLEIKRNGLGADGKGYTQYDQVIDKLTHASWDRVFVIYDAIQMGIPLSRIYEITKIDMWFLKQYQELYELEKEISKFNINSLDKGLLLEAKQKGFADRQIAHMLDCFESEVNKKRKDMGYLTICKTFLFGLQKQPLIKAIDIKLRNFFFQFVQFLVLFQEPHVNFGDFVNSTEWDSHLNGIVYNKNPIPTGMGKFINYLVVLSVAFTICP